jgi:Nif-specific regulatory protein
MADTATGYLVPRLDAGYGEPVPLVPGRRLAVGRAPTNGLVLRDDLCSREHAEVVHAAGGWHVRDLGSLNGTTVNGEKLARECRLAAGDVVKFGGSAFVFALSPADLPPVPPPSTPPEVAIKSRLGETKYLAGGGRSPDQTVVTPRRVPQGEAVARLYRLAVDMAAAETPAALAEIAIDGLLGATPAEVGAVLAVKAGRELEPVAYRARGPRTYHTVSQFVSGEVLSSGQAVLAENVAADRHLKDRESLNEMQVTSLVCAPVAADGRTLGLLHLYCTDPRRRLNPDDLEFALAVARQLGVVWAHLRREAALSAEVRVLKDQFRVESELIGSSPCIRRVEQQVARVAGTKATVLIRGESGVGKELVARAVHRSSPRADRPFVCLNCAALTETLLESELFGHEKGAFTGATERLIGKFEAADGGTIFLDEIGEMSPNTQAKFLRVLEGQPFERVGGNTPITADVRVVAATNRPLEEAVREGSFRKDLFFRLQVVQLDVPPLRDRPGDVRPIAEHFVRRFVRETGRRITGFTPAAITKLERYHWPGNVRELRNVIERAVALAAGPTLDEADIWLSPLDAPAAPAAAYEPVKLDEIERRHIEATLRHTDWNKSRAAEILGIERSTLDRKIKGFGLKR